MFSLTHNSKYLTPATGISNVVFATAATIMTSILETGRLIWRQVKVLRGPDEEILKIS